IVLAEMQPFPAIAGRPVPRVVGRRLDAAGLNLLGSEQEAYHLRLLSRPFAYASARADGEQPNVYAAVGYKHLSSNDEWGQSLAIVVNLDVQEWASAADFTVRPRPAVNINTAIMDARIAGYSPSGSFPDGTLVSRRANHLSTPSGA